MKSIVAAAVWLFAACASTAADPAPGAETATARGEALFKANGCIACHSPSGIPLAGAAVYTDAEIGEILASPPPGMPLFALEPAGVADLSAYLRAAVADGSL